MADEIVNRVAKSGLVQLDLEDFLPKEPCVILDIAPWLFEGMVLKEKDFKEHLNNHNWEQYKGKYLAVDCTADAIIPAWAYMLIAKEAHPFAIKTVQGDLDFFYKMMIKEAIDKIEVTSYQDAKVVIKGCGSGKIDAFAYTEIAGKLMGTVKSVMYGEPCSTVPIYKRK